MGAALLFLFLGAFFFLGERKREVTLEFALFSGSNWDVEVQDSYVVIDDAISRFEALHPGVHITYTSGILKEEYSEWLSRKLLKDDAPDLMVLLDQDFSRFAELGVLQNLDVLMEADDTFSRESYYETALRSGMLGGVQYALPMETIPYLMFVNKTLLNQEGIPLPDENYSFSDLYRICRRVTRDTDGDGKPDQFGIYKYSWLDAAFANGAALFSEDGQSCDFTDEKLLEAIRFVKRLNALSRNEKVTQETFDSGRVAFMPLSFAEYRTYKTYPYRIKKYSSFQWDCLPMPKGPSGTNASIVDSLNIGISRRSRNRELSWEFLKFLTGDRAVQTALNERMPAASVLREVTERGGVLLQSPEEAQQEENMLDGALIGSVIENGHVKPKFAAYQEAVQLADGEITKLYDEDTDLENAMRLIQRKVQRFIEK